MTVATERRHADGWLDSQVAVRQHQAYRPLLEAAHRGQPRLDLEVAAKAVAATGLVSPRIIEIGCGSGYYGEVLPLLLDAPVRYIGLDYSTSMVALARQVYPRVSVLTGDACELPFGDASCDILLSGNSLMHIVGYQAAIAESARVSAGWCVFHTVPIIVRQETALLQKKAYGADVCEVIFNRTELETLFRGAGLSIEAVWDSIPYDVAHVIGERSFTLTYLCRKNGQV
ncbi:MAG: class I SAM-dependent methyltransferase [Anaerolineae bacterium]